MSLKVRTFPAASMDPGGDCFALVNRLRKQGLGCALSKDAELRPGQYRITRLPADYRVEWRETIPAPAAVAA